MFLVLVSKVSKTTYMYWSSILTSLDLKMELG